MNKPSYYLWTRGENPKLSDHFTGKEFTCQCGICKQQKLSSELIDLLEQIRTELKAPITVTSGYRCERHQQVLLNSGAVETVKISSHCMGQAADITCDRDNFYNLQVICLRFANNVGTSAKFVHVDVRPISGGVKRRWKYSV